MWRFNRTPVKHSMCPERHIYKIHKYRWFCLWSAILLSFSLKKKFFIIALSIIKKTIKSNVRQLLHTMITKHKEEQVESEGVRKQKQTLFTVYLHTVLDFLVLFCCVRRKGRARVRDHAA